MVRRVIEVAMAAVLLVGCRTVEPVVQTQVEWRDRVEYRDRIDSVMIHDSVFIREQLKGDTVYLTETRWRTEYRDKLVTDTFIRVDSIPVPYEVVQVEYRTLGIVKIAAWFGLVAFLGLMAYLWRRI